MFPGFDVMSTVKNAKGLTEPRTKNEEKLSNNYSGSRSKFMTLARFEKLRLKKSGSSNL